MKVYGIELSEYEAQDVCKIFKNKKDAEHLCKLYNSVLSMSNIIHGWIIDLSKYDDKTRELILEIEDSIKDSIYDIILILGISDFYDSAKVREYKVE